ncbi:hsp90 co-chaperone Cdc37 [Tulasnella sp. 403]|nr:hsp90 co-chaperone Cdc37 [Tulasnella sp. 403]
MPLNYSKWDALEVSDDSDIEGHPNVDHKSLVRWRQRDIHERREARKRRIAELQSIISLNTVLIPRVKTICKEVEDGGPSKYSAIVERLASQPSSDKPTGGDLTYDQMIRDLLMKVRDELKDAGKPSPSTEDLVKALQEHVEKMTKVDQESRSALDDELKEQRKKITSEDIHDGFSRTSVVKEEPAPQPPHPTKKKTKTTTEIEVLNPGAPPAAVLSNLPPPAQIPSATIESEDDDDRIPDLSATMLEFSKIPLGQFERSYKFIQHHPREIMFPGAYDQMVIAGFRAAVKGEKKYAKKCVHQALIIQYCEKLGRDGVKLFFQRMFSGDPRAKAVFDHDMEQTYGLMLQRAEKAAKEEDDPKERIQLVAEDPSQSITFNVPTGPPPETIKLEGPGMEELDPDQVRDVLQRRWDIFEGFPENLRDALKTGSLDKVNDILGEMEVQDAEDIVKLLDIAGILSFSQEGIIDQTGKGDDGATEDAEPTASASETKEGSPEKTAEVAS